MVEETASPKSAKPRKRVAGKPATRQAVEKAKYTFHLTTEASQRLDVHCTMMFMDRSELVEHLIHTHLRRYVVSDRGGGDGIPGGDAAA